MADYGVQDIIKEVEKADGAPLEGNHNRTPSSRDITNVTTTSIFGKTHPYHNRTPSSRDITNVITISMFEKRTLQC
jgi:hypothetical protein